MIVPTSDGFKLRTEEAIAGRTNGAILYTETWGERDVRTRFSGAFDLGEGSKYYEFSLEIDQSASIGLPFSQIHVGFNQELLGATALSKRARKKAIELAATLPEELKTLGSRLDKRELAEAWRKTLEIYDEIPHGESASPQGRIK